MTRYRFVFHTPRGTWKTDWLNDSHPDTVRVNELVTGKMKGLFSIDVINPSSAKVVCYLSDELLSQSVIEVERKEL
jgi:hypothetical protein